MKRRRTFVESADCPVRAIQAFLAAFFLASFLLFPTPSGYPSPFTTARIVNLKSKTCEVIPRSSLAPSRPTLQHPKLLISHLFFSKHNNNNKLYLYHTIQNKNHKVLTVKHSKKTQNRKGIKKTRLKKMLFFLLFHFEIKNFEKCKHLNNNNYYFKKDFKCVVE